MTTKIPSWPGLTHIAESISSPRENRGPACCAENMELDSGFRRNDDENTVMAGLDPRLSGLIFRSIAAPVGRGGSVERAAVYRAGGRDVGGRSEERRVGK